MEQVGWGLNRDKEERRNSRATWREDSSMIPRGLARVVAK